MAVKQSNRLRALRTLLKGKSVRNLRPFQDVTLWERLSKDERKALSLVFIQAGKRVLLKKSPAAYNYFSFAENVAFFSKEMWAEQAKVWQIYGRKFHNERAFYKAKEKLDRAANIHSTSFEEALELGKINCSLAFSSRNSEYVEDADLWFQRAKSLVGNKKSYEKSLHSFWGTLWELSYLISEEPSDLLKGIHHYQKIYEQSSTSPSFLQTYSLCLLRMERASSKTHYVFQALDMLKVSMDKERCAKSPSLQKCYAKCLKRAYELSGKESFYKQSLEMFRTLISKKEDSDSLYLELGCLLLHSGQRTSNPKRVYQAYEIFLLIRQRDPENFTAWQYSAEALAYLGYYTDQFKLLKEAELLAKHSLKIAPEEAYGWYVYGDVLEKLGAYFEDELHIFQSIECYQKGISLDKELPELWTGLADAVQYLAEANGDLEMFEKAVSYNLRALENRPEDPYIMNRVGWLSLRKSEISSQKSDVENSVAYLEKAIKQRSSNGGNPEVSWLYNYGCALDFLGDYSESVECYEKAISVLAYVTRLEPDDIAARYNLALAWSHLGEVTSEAKYFLIAIEYFQGIINDDDQDDLSWNDWGVALLNLASIEGILGESPLVSSLFKEAEEKLEKAVQLGNANAYYHLACHSILTHQFDKGIDYLYIADAKGGLPPVEEMLKDDWLEEIKDQPAFKRLLDDLGGAL